MTHEPPDDDVIPFPSARDRRRPSEGRGEFFALDSRMWEKACGLGVNAAVAYMALACGTGPDNATTSWSVHALEQRFFTRQRAQKAIADLIKAKLLDQTGFGGKATKYKLTGILEREPADAVDGIEALEPVRQHREPEWRFNERHREWKRAREELAAANDARVWLPKSLVEGVPGDVAAPLELVRRMQDPLALRLLVSLYHHQNLAEDGALHWRVIRREHKMQAVCSGEGFAAHAITTLETRCWPHQDALRGQYVGDAKGGEDKNGDEAWISSGKAFWNRWSAFVRAGLVEEVPYLVEADTDDALALWACSELAGEPIEREIAAAGQAAAIAMLKPDLLTIYRDAGTRFVLVPNECNNAKVFGLYRLRYRPRTATTAAWWARLQEEGRATADRFRAMAGLPPKMRAPSAS